MAVSSYEAFKAIFSTTFLINTCALGANVCNESLSTVQQVTFCPRSFTELQLAVERKRCDAMANIQTCVDPKKFVYHCLVNQQNDGFVEVCAPEWILAGFCGYYDTVLDEIKANVYKDCTKFAYPCPDVFNSSDSYKYQDCYEIKKKMQEIQIGDEKGQAHPSASSSINHAIWIVPSILAVGFFVALIFVYLKMRKMSFETVFIDDNECQQGDQQIKGHFLVKKNTSTQNRKPVKRGFSDSNLIHKVAYGGKRLMHSYSADGYPSEVGQCFHQLSNSMCQGHPTGSFCTPNPCCATVENAWRYSNEQCPVSHFPCRCRISPCHKTMSCQDMNESIAIPRVCGGGTCVNSVGFHSCECKETKRQNQITGDCEDMNESIAIPRVCGGGTCVNSVGFHSCECKETKRQNQITGDCEDSNAEAEGDRADNCEKDALIYQRELISSSKEKG